MGRPAQQEITMPNTMSLDDIFNEVEQQTRAELAAYDERIRTDPAFAAAEKAKRDALDAKSEAYYERLREQGQITEGSDSEEDEDEDEESDDDSDEEE